MFDSDWNKFIVTGSDWNISHGDWKIGHYQHVNWLCKLCSKSVMTQIKIGNDKKSVMTKIEIGYVS